MRRPIVADMLTIAFALLCLVIAIFRTAADLRLEIFALRHQLGVLRRQRSGRLHLVHGDRILWVWLYRLWPRCLRALLIVKPATVIRWHRAGFGLYWHWRSKPRRTGRPSVDREIRDLIRQMSQANPLWGAPRIHDELLTLGICIGQTAVAKHMIRSLRPLSPNWRTFLRNQMDGIAAVDMFVIATVTFRILYVMVVLGHDRRKIVHFDVTPSTPRRSGSHARSPKLSRGTPRRAIYCGTVTHPMARASAGASKRWASRRLSRHHDRPGRMPMSSGSSAPFATSASTMSSSSTSAICAAFCHLMPTIITDRGRILPSMLIPEQAAP